MPFSLLHPGLFAFGLACVSIPIILHLLKRKRRPIPWGAMRFLEQAYRKRRRILTIEQLILLALRCLLLALIAMGVGSLMLGSGLTRNLPTTMVILIDQSIGSALDEGELSSLEKNKRFALRALSELDASNGDRAALIGLAKPAAGIVVPASSDLGTIKRLIEQLEPTDSAVDLQSAMARAGTIGTDADRPIRRALVLATTGRGLEHVQTSSSALGEFDRVLMRSIEYGQIENIGVADATMTRSLVTHSGTVLPMGVRVELVRSGIQGFDETNSTILIWDQHLGQAGEVIGRRTVRWKPGQEELSAILAIDPGSIRAIGARTAMLKVTIDDDANLRDNARLIPLATRTKIRVGVIDQQTQTNDNASSISASRWVRAALSPSDDESMGISIVDIAPSRASSLLVANLDALIVLAPSLLDDAAWERISTLNRSGMLVIVTPDIESGSLDWLDHIDSMANGLIGRNPSIQTHDPAIGLANEGPANTNGLLAGLAFEYDQLARSVLVMRSLSLENADSDSRSLVATLADGSAYAVQSSGQDGRGIVVVFGSAFELSWTNLMARPIFVAMMNEMVRQGVGIGTSMPVLVAGDRVTNDPWVIASHRLTLDSEPNQSGSIENTSRAGVIAQLDSQGTMRGLVVIAPDASGAKTDLMSQEELSELILASVNAGQIDWVDQAPTGGSGDEKSILQSSTPGVSIALWVLMAAGFIALLELILARLFSVRLYSTQVNGAGA